jgi:uncharacterized protein YwgA
MRAKVATSKDLLMLMLYARGPAGEQCEPIRGRTRVMKMVFLFEKEILRKFNFEKIIAADALPDFSPYDFGPFSAQIFTDLEFLHDLGMVSVQPVYGAEPAVEESIEYSYWQASNAMESGDAGPEHEEEFALTSLGRQFVEEGQAGTLTKSQWQVLDDFKARCSGTSLRGLLRYVYTKYPDTTTKSKIRDEIISESPY